MTAIVCVKNYSSDTHDVFSTFFTRKTDRCCSGKSSNCSVAIDGVSFAIVLVLFYMQQLINAFARRRTL